MARRRAQLRKVVTPWVDTQGRLPARDVGPAVEPELVVRTHGRRARAGVQILEHGGNAIGAAIAANATIGLKEPTGNGLGGDLFILYEAKTGTVHGLNASGWAPSGLTPEFLASKGITEMPQRGIYSVTVHFEGFFDGSGDVYVARILMP